MKDDYLDYSSDFKGTSLKTCGYMKKEIELFLFDLFVKNNLTVEENAKSYYTLNGETEILCYGFSGVSINERLDNDELQETLYHELFCLVEYVSRCIKQYPEVTKSKIGHRAYKRILEMYDN